MKIRCGSHQQNRSIVRPGLSLMATKVALTAEEFRENSQRSIALFNTEKLSTNSTHVLKSAYCNSVHFCSCNLHGACGGKGACRSTRAALSCRCNLHGACGGKDAKNRQRRCGERCNLHGACGGKVFRFHLLLVGVEVAICTGRVEAKVVSRKWFSSPVCCNLHGACGGKVSVRLPSHECHRCNLHGACGGKEIKKGWFYHV